MDIMRMKGQIWSTDLAISIIVFLSILSVFLLSWNYIGYEVQSSSQLIEMEGTALSVSDALIRSRGQPGDWDVSSVYVMGLAEEEGILNATKVGMISSMDYQKASALMGLGRYYFHIEIRNSTGASLASAGMAPANATRVVSAERYVVYNGRPAVMRMLLWI
jgi:hypothetical protein